MKHIVVAIVTAAAMVLAGGACQTPQGQSAPVGAGAPPPSTPLPPLTRTVPPPNLGMIERFGWQTVEQLRDAYVAADAPAFLAKVSRGFYRGYTQLESSLQATFAARPRIQLEIAIQEVIAEDDKVSLRVRWNRTLTPPEGPADSRTGESVLIFLKTDGALRLIDYRKDSLFGISGI